jgi:glycosyltransferase involved in cell wall biosynthesis
MQGMNGADFERVVAIVPTVAAALAARTFAKRYSIPFFVVFQDISSTGARESGMPGAKWLGKVSEYLERRAIKGAAGAAIVSPAMAGPVSKLNSSKAPITLLPNYSLQSESKISRSEGRKRMGFAEDEIIFLHTGNMGYKQDLLNIVETSKQIENEKIKIYVVGHGNQESVVRQAITPGSKAIWLPSVSSEDYPYLLAAADVLLVNERSTQLSMSLPSKVTSYLSSNRPILAAVPADGATAKYLSGVAVLVPAGEPVRLAAAMEEIAASPEIGFKLADRGLQKFHSELSKESAYLAYLKWLKS